jgi:hypothetical protein
LGQLAADRYPEVWALHRRKALQAKHVRGVSSVSLNKAAGGSALKGENPKGASSKPRANPPWAARDSCKGQSLEVGARRTGSLVRQREIASS